jgi:acetyl esterase/lipase
MNVRLRTWLKRVGLATLVLLLATLVFVALTPQGRTGFKTALFVIQVLPTGPFKPLEWFTSSPERERVRFPVTHGQGTADIYRPSGGESHPAVLLFLGVAPAGPDDPRVVNLGESLARMGIVTMFYWSPDMLDKRINPNDVENVVHAFSFLREQPYVDSRRVGMGGFCVGASFVLIAAARQEIRDAVAYVNAFTPYYDMRDLTLAIASGTRFDRDEFSPWTVDSLTREVFELQLINTLEDQAERNWLHRRVILGVDEAPPGELSAQGQAALALIEGVNLDKARELLFLLPEVLVDGMAETSPSMQLGGLRARTFVMHDRGDSLVPVDESRRLSRQLEKQGVDTSYTEFKIFDHIDPNPVDVTTTVPELLKLFRHLYSLFRTAS